MSNVEFDNIKILYALIPLGLILIISFIIFVRKKGFRFYKLFSLFLHLCICGLICLGLAGIKVTKIETTTQVYVLADVSDTLNLNLNNMDETIEKLSKGLPLSNQLGVVAFAKDSEELVKPGENLKKLETSTVDRSATNLQDALTYTASLFDVNSKKRIIVLSDGRQTDGDATTVINQLEELNIRIDTMYVESLLPDFVKEIQIENIQGNNTSYLNSGETLNLTIRSNYDANVSFNVYDNDVLIDTVNYDMKTGVNQFSYNCVTDQVGIHNYKFEVNVPDDFKLENNTYYFTQEIHEKCKIIALTSTYEELTRIMELIGPFAEVKGYITYSKIPTSIENYIEFDEIILSNISLSSIENSETLINTFETLVSKYGKTLLTFGGESTYFDGGFNNSKLKNMLPVNIDPNDTKQRTAVIIVLDVSGSMGGEKLQYAKLGAIGCLDILDEQDYIGVITFEDNVQVVQPLTPLTFKPSISKKISSIREGGGTVMTPGLTEAYNQMNNLKADISNRCVIVISDGSPADGGQIDVVKKMVKDGISVSTIEIGGYGNTLLKQMAIEGNGRNYSIISTTKIPEIIIDAVAQTTVESKLYGNIPVNIALKSDKVVQNITSLPNIKGFNYGTAKYNATTVLNTSYTLDDGEKLDNIPLYAYWNYGEGKVASFMSGVTSTSLAEELFKSEVGENLFSSIVQSCVPKNRVDSMLKIMVQQNGFTSNLSVDAPSLTSQMHLKAEVTNPNGDVKEYEFGIKNGQFRQVIDTNEIGNYQLRLMYYHEKFANVYEYKTNFWFSYSSEYNVFEKSDNIVLWQICCNEGTLAQEMTELLNVEQDDIIYNQYFEIPLLIISLILFVLDIFIRMIRAKDIKNLFKKTVS